MLNAKVIYKQHKAKGFTLADQAILSGVSFLLTILLTRSLGLEQVGVYTLIWLVVMFAISLNQATIISPLLIFGSREKGHKDGSVNEYFKGAFLLQVLFAFALAVSIGIFMIFYLNFYPQIQLQHIPIKVAIIVFVTLPNDFFRKYFYLTQTHHKALIFDILGYGLLVVLLIYSIINNSLTLDKAFTYIIISQGVASIFALTQYHLISLRKDLLKRVVKKHSSFSSWLILAAIFQWFAGNIFLIIAAKALSIEALGAIRIMQNLIGVLNVLFISIENYVPISASRIFDANGYQPLMKYLKQIISKAGLLFTLLLVAMIILSKQLIHITYGQEYVQYAYLLSGFIGLYFFVFISMNLRIGLRAMEITRPIFFSYAGVALFSLLAAKPLIAMFGDLGVIIGLAACQIIMSMYYLLVLRKQNPLSN